jgi:hypothetical protein
VSGYEYDVFVSYSRVGNVGQWVQNHLSEVLTACLIDELGGRAKVFLDVRMETGVVWPDQLRAGLGRSKLLVAVWSPAYFESKWCMAEMQTMLEREQLVDVHGGIIFPLVFNDGRSFPDWANQRQTVSFKEHGYPYRQFRDAVGYLAFHAQVRRLAEEIAERLDRVPPWREDWPVVLDPAVLPPRRAALPEL